MRTLSARILLGFTALTVAFGVITATVVVNMQKVEDQILIVSAAYVPLALTSKDLALHQRDLKAFVDEGFEDAPGLTRARLHRDQSLTRTLQILDQRDEPVTADISDFHDKILHMQTEVSNIAPVYVNLIAKLHNHVNLSTDPTIGQLRNAETQLEHEASELTRSLEERVRSTASQLRSREHTLRLGTIYLGLTAIVLGLLITIWVLITLRPLRRLQVAARQVASGDYASRIPVKGPLEVADLARELNSMAHAIEERERELVRSERLAAVGKIAAMITHEVRNPLSSIGLNTELLEDELGKPGDAKEARELCRSIHREVDRLTQITEEYLAFARLPKPKLAYEQINPLVEALAGFVREDLAAKHVALKVDLGASDPAAMVDAAQLRQCLMNLVRNASEAVVAKGGGSVSLRTQRRGDKVVIEVADDGIGVSAEALPRLFDPFFSTKEGGSGLGLALTQQIVKDHDGDLSVESVVGRGTTFTISVQARG